MKVRNNYNECLTNLACSIRKYFELDYKHNTIDYIDKILNENKPKNVVTILCDGMGSNIMDRILSKDSFLLKYRIKSITTVFPATTVAATTSMMTGLNPVETAMLGWDMYYKDIDKTITTFMNSEKGDEEYTPLQEAIEYKNKHMITKSIMEPLPLPPPSPPATRPRAASSICARGPAMCPTRPSPKSCTPRRAIRWASSPP